MFVASSVLAIQSRPVYTNSATAATPETPPLPPSDSAASHLAMARQEVAALHAKPSSAARFSKSCTVRKWMLGESYHS